MRRRDRAEPAAATLLISPRSPDELAAAGAPAGVDVRALHATGRLRLLRTPSPADLAARGSDGLDAAYRDLAAPRRGRGSRTASSWRTSRRSCSSTRSTASAPLLGRSLDGFRAAGVTLVVGLGEPANEASEQLIGVVRDLVDATLTLVVDGETRRLDLARRATASPEA